MKKTITKGILVMQPGLEKRPENWFVMPNLVFEMLEVSGVARLIYGYLCRCIHDNFPFPTYRKIKQVCGVGSTTIKKSLEELENFNLLRVERKGNNRNNYEYILIVPDGMVKEYKFKARGEA